MDITIYPLNHSAFFAFVSTVLLHSKTDNKLKKIRKHSGQIYVNVCVCMCFWFGGRVDACVGLRDKNRGGGATRKAKGRQRDSVQRDGFEMLIRPTVETKHTFHNDDDGDTMMDLE